MQPTNTFYAALAIALGLTGAPVVAQEATPKISMEQAEAIALKVAHGSVVSKEYEKEDGAWRYSFDIREGERIHEIGVDPETGAIVEDSWEDLGDKD
jgi:uncharacterized membrane protein YkoI